MEGKKLEYIFSLSFYSAYLHQKKCHSWRTHSFILIFIFLLKKKEKKQKNHNSLPKDNPPLRRTGPQPRKEFLQPLHLDSSQGKGQTGKGSRFLSDLSIRGSLGKCKLLPLFANRLPPTGREPDPRETAYHSKLPWLACQAILRMVIIPTPKPQV